jgi:hypothetical protein
VGAC